MTAPRARGFTIVCVLTAATLVAATGQSGTSGTAGLSGSLVTGDTPAQPVRRARVTANSVDQSIGRTATTDDAGRFAFTDMPAARYLLHAAKSGHLPTNFGAKRPGGLGTPIVVANGQAISGVVMTMTRGAVIAGTVFDPNGQPEPAAEVRLLRYAVDPLTGQRRLMPATSISETTDGGGAYRIHDLLPGEYFVAALVRSLLPLMFGAPDFRRPLASGLGATEAATSEGVTYAPIFYPGTPDAAVAVPITVAAGEERTGIDFSLALTRTSSITGSVTGPPGLALATTRLEILPVDRPRGVQLGLGGLDMVNAVGAESTGQYAFHAVPPGQYRVLARSGTVTATPPGLSPSSAGQRFLATYWGQSLAFANGTDVAVAVDLKPASRIEGRVVADGASPRPNFLAATLVLRDLARGALSFSPTREGDIAISGLAPGRYRLSVELDLGERTWALRSITIGDREISDAPFDLAEGEQLRGVTVTLTDHPAELSGVVRPSGGGAPTDYFVVAFSTDSARWVPGSRRVAQTRPDAAGRYVFKNLPAGEYWLAVTTDLLSEDLSDPSFLRGLSRTAAMITLMDGQKATWDFRMAAR
jgi:hypothetical protein